MGFKPNWNVHWKPTIGKMLEMGVKAYACCSVCERRKEIDLQAMIDAKGPDICLHNKRTKTCRLKEGCGGRNWFAHDRSTVIMPFRDAETSGRWLSEPHHERK